MASNYTSNYNLNQWEPEDKVIRTEFNEDNSKIDAALKALADKDTVLEGSLVSQAATIAKLGNCQIHYSTYTGDGATSRTYNFPAPPVIVFRMAPSFFSAVAQGNTTAFCMESSTDWNGTVTWSGNSVTIAYLGTLAGGDYKTGNRLGTTYYMVALIDAAE